MGRKLRQLREFFRVGLNISRPVIGRAMAVHRDLGNGFLEIIYVRALEIELASSEIRPKRQVSLSVSYKGKQNGIFVLAQSKKIYVIGVICGQSSCPLVKPAANHYSMESAPESLSVALGTSTSLLFSANDRYI